MDGNPPVLTARARLPTPESVPRSVTPYAGVPDCVFTSLEETKKIAPTTIARRADETRRRDMACPFAISPTVLRLGLSRSNRDAALLCQKRTCVAELEEEREQ